MGIARALVLKAYLVTNFAAESPIIFFGNPLWRRNRGNAPGLEHPYFSFHHFQDLGRQAGGFTCTGSGREHQRRIFQKRPRNSGEKGIDG